MIQCPTCLDSGMVASDGTPFPTVKAAGDAANAKAGRDLAFDLVEGILRMMDCPNCKGAAGAFSPARLYAAGQRDGLAAAQLAASMSAPPLQTGEPDGGDLVDRITASLPRLSREELRCIWQIVLTTLP